MNGLVQGGKKKYQHEAMNEQRKRQPDRADADAHEITRHHQSTSMTGELRNTGGVGTLRKRSQSARRFRMLAHCFADGSGHRRLRYGWLSSTNMVSAAR